MSKPSLKVKNLPPSLVMTFKLSPLLTRVATLFAVALLTWGLMSQFKGSLDILETRLANIGWTLNSDAQPESRLTIIAIDEKSISKVGPWPWPRATIANLSATLAEPGVSLQLYDIVFPESKPGDDELVNTLNNTASVIAQVPIMRSEQHLQTGTMSKNIVGMRCQKPLPVTYTYLANHATFNSVNKGHITPVVAPDGAINNMAPFICVEGQVYPALAISGILSAAGIEQPSINITPGKGLLAPHWQASVAQYPELTIPLDDQGNMRLSYRKAPESFQVISAVDILNGSADLSLLDNTWVQVGATAFGLGDVVPTPYSGAVPGIELQARLITSLLDNDLPYTPANATYLLIALSALFAGLLWFLSATSGRSAAWGLPLAGLLMPCFAWLLHVQLLNHYNLWLGWMTPALFAILAGMLLSLLEHNRSRLEQSRVYNNFDSYLPPNAADKIAYNLPSGTVAVERCEFTLLSADLRNFSAFNEAHSAETSVSLLHEFFVKACHIIEQKGGSVHEFKGDALLAAWPDNNVAQALAAAQQLQEEITPLLESTQSAETEPLALGIGIEQGAALSGSLGPANRRTHTMLGDTVTKTLRIQEMTGDIAQPILLGPKAAGHLPKGALESQGDYLLAGLQRPYTLFAPFIGKMDDQERTNVTSLKLLQGGGK